MEEEPEENPLTPDSTFGLLDVGSYGYVVLWDKARKVKKREFYGFSLPKEED